MGHFKKELRKIRQKMGMTIRGLARKSKVSASYISMLENGQLANDPSDDTITKLEKALGRKKGELLVYSNSMSTTAIKIKQISSNPEDATKMRVLIDEIQQDKGVLDKILKQLGK